jgi:hypothetical protein
MDKKVSWDDKEAKRQPRMIDARYDVAKFRLKWTKLFLLGCVGKLICQ